MRGHALTDRLKNKVALVTGSGRGIGRAIAETFGGEGAAVVVATRTAEHGQKAVDAIVAAGGRAALYQTELQSAAEVADIVDFTLQTFGGIDIMVHNAALPVPLAVEDMTDDVLDRTYALNCKAGVWLTKQCIAPMRQRGGGTCAVHLFRDFANCASRRVGLRNLQSRHQWVDSSRSVRVGKI